MLAEELAPPYALRQSTLIYPEQPTHDDFLETMTSVLMWSRVFGVAGSSNRLWKAWGGMILALLLSITIGAVYKLVKLLAGLTIYSAGNRSMTARIAGSMFYTSSLMSLILSWRLSSKWNTLSTKWAAVEKRSAMIMPSDGKLKRKMITVTCFVAFCATGEYVMNVISTITFDCPLSQFLEIYLLGSHGFIIQPMEHTMSVLSAIEMNWSKDLLEAYILESFAFMIISSDYSVWIAIPLMFMSVIATILWNFQDLLVILLSVGLTSRYKRLTQCVARVCENDQNEVHWNKNKEVLKVYMWRKIRDAYVKQAMLVRDVDHIVGATILISSFGNFYFICLQLFLGITQGVSGTFLRLMYYVASLSWITIRFTCMVLFAAEVNVHSKQALGYIHSCNAKNYNIEVERLQKQLSKDYVALSGLGFFYLNRNMLLQVAGAVITYELVLVQFDTKGIGYQMPLNLTNA